MIQYLKKNYLLINDVLKEYDNMKEAFSMSKNSKNIDNLRTKFTNSNRYLYCIKRHQYCVKCSITMILK